MTTKPQFQPGTATPAYLAHEAEMRTSCGTVTVDRYRNSDDLRIAFRSGCASCTFAVTTAGDHALAAELVNAVNAGGRAVQ